MEDRKRDYLVKTFSRTNKKDYENYIVNAIWQRLNNLNIKPVTQQYVKRRKGSFALIDLYFPQFNIAIECDEQFHKKNSNRLKDTAREIDINKQLEAIDGKNLKIVHIDASLPVEEINKRINKIVLLINKVYDSTTPKPKWDIIDPVIEAKNQRSISVDDDIRFSNIYIDIRKLFGKEPTKNPRIRCTFKVSDNAIVWRPKMAIYDEKTILSESKSWINLISEDKK